MCGVLQREGGDTRASGPQIPKGMKVKQLQRRTQLFRIMGRGVRMLLLKLQQTKFKGVSKEGLVRTHRAQCTPYLYQAPSKTPSRTLN